MLSFMISGAMAQSLTVADITAVTCTAMTMALAMPPAICRTKAAMPMAKAMHIATRL